MIQNELEKEKEGQMEIVGYVGGGEKTKREKTNKQTNKHKHMEEIKKGKIRNGN